MRFKGYIIFILCAWMLVSCGKKECSKLEKALQLSGDHRAELEKVLDYFSQRPEDSLKLKSAVFLIENMPGHWGPDSNSIHSYKVGIDSIPGLSFEERKILLNLPSKYTEFCPTMVKTEDIHTIKAEDLIRHISKVCGLKDSCTWLKDLEFEAFCEYLLPYRIENEWAEFSPDTLDNELIAAITYALRNYDDCQHSPYSISTYIQRENAFRMPHNLKDTLFSKLIYDWENQNKMSVIRLRRLGIPVALDYIPIQRPDEKTNHWYIVIDSHIIPKSLYKIEESCTGKVYRRTFSANPLPVTDSNEFVPPFFRDPFQKDITDLYLHTTDLKLSLTVPQQIKYAYLAMYNGKEWHPIAYSKANKGECLFAKLGKDCVYLPICYPAGRMEPLAPPFILRSSGKIAPLTAPADSIVTLNVERLRPHASKNEYYNELLVNSYFECADNKNFTNPDTAFIIKKPPYYKFETIYPLREMKKRYWRLKIPLRYCYLAELHFLNPAGEQLKGQYVAKDTNRAGVLTDNDPLTYKGIWTDFGIDFGKPVNVGSIRYMLSNDGYNIWPGNEYELLYFQDGEWRSAGKQEAEKQEIIFNDVPANRLYQILDKTNGKPGNPFTWENGRVRFW